MLAIEAARGGTLGDLIKSNSLAATTKRAEKLNSANKKKQSDPYANGLSEEECAKAIKGILQGLRHIHSLDLVHRDLKPSNVVIDDISNLETVKLVDFGLAIKF